MTEKQFAAQHLLNAMHGLVSEAKNEVTKDYIATGLGKKHIADSTVDKVHSHITKMVAPVIKRFENLLKIKAKKEEINKKDAEKIAEKISEKKD